MYLWIGCGRYAHVLRCIIGDPGDEGNLASVAAVSMRRRGKTDQVYCDAPLALAGGVVLDIVDGVSATNALVSSSVLALCVEKLLAEDGVVGLGRRVLNDNLLPVVRDLVDDPLGRLAELEVVECSDALGRNGNTMVGNVSAIFWTSGRSQGGREVRMNIPRLGLEMAMLVFERTEVVGEEHTILNVCLAVITHGGGYSSGVSHQLCSAGLRQQHS